jgi:hypothetical protein
MPRKSKINDLPVELREWLDAELIRRGFKDYVQLAQALKAQGHDIGKNVVWRHGNLLEKRMSQLKVASEQAKALVTASPDEAGDMSEALLRLMQEKLFQLLMEMDVDPDSASLGSIAKALAPLMRASIAQKKYAAEVKAKVGEQLAKLQAQAEGEHGDRREAALAMLQRVRAVYEGAL